MLRDQRHGGAVEKAMRFLAESCKAGRYGSTQSTVLALRAIIAYDKLMASPKAAGQVSVLVDGMLVGRPVEFDAKAPGALVCPDISGQLTKGAHTIELKMAGGSRMPCSVAVNCNALTPDSSPECRIGLSVAIVRAELTEGEAAEVNVSVTNKSSTAAPMTVAIIGLPGGLEPRHEQLKELVKKGTLDFYEVRGNEVVLYWRGLKAAESIDAPISVIAAAPGSYTGTASRAYLYYSDEHKQWAGGLKVKIAPKKDEPL